MSQTAIDFLNNTVKMKVAPSSLHGVGVFAIKDIQAGSKLFADRAPFPYKISVGNVNKLMPAIKDHLVDRWPSILQGKGFVYPDIFLQGFMNHSDEPNYDNKLDLSIKDIKEGDEITEDYRQIEGWREAYPFLVV